MASVERNVMFHTMLTGMFAGMTVMHTDCLWIQAGVGFVVWFVLLATDECFFRKRNKIAFELDQQ